MTNQVRTKSSTAGNDVVIQPTVTASDIGQAARCPYALYLAKNGRTPNQQSQQARRRGTRKHAQWTRNQGRKPFSITKAILVLVAIVVGLLILALVL